MNMTLQQKGPIQPAPALDEPLQRVSLEVQSWMSVISATHWHLFQPGLVDGADFYVDEQELGHLHLDGELHLATTPDLSVALIKAGLARRFRFGGSYGGWVEASIRNQAEADHALWLLRLNYHRLNGVETDILQARIAERCR